MINSNIEFFFYFSFQALLNDGKLPFFQSKIDLPINKWSSFFFPRGARQRKREELEVLGRSIKSCANKQVEGLYVFGVQTSGK